MKRLVQLVIAIANLAIPGIVFAQEQSTYDPSPFLKSMIDLRAAAVTCDPFVANSPAARTDSLEVFFEELNQPLPALADGVTQSSLNKFIGSQAASLCRDKLDAAFAAYDVQAAAYVEGKPDEWPEPPDIPRAPWCGSENCLEF